MNGVSGNLSKMYEQLRKEGTLELIVGAPLATLFKPQRALRWLRSHDSQVESHGPETSNPKEPTKIS